MRRLPAAVKIHALIGLACYESPEKVTASIREKFGLSLSRQCIEAWNPERAAGARLGAEWRGLFYETRDRFLREIADIPLASRSYRLRALNRMARQAEEMGNYALLIRVLAQAARETNGT